MYYFLRFIDGMGILHMSYSNWVMMGVALFLAYLGIVKKYEPLLLIPISFGMLVANVPVAGLSAHYDGGMINFLYQGITNVIFPPLIFLCLGAMTDFGPMIRSPHNVLIGLGGQLGILVTFGGALLLGNLFPNLLPFTIQEAATVGIIGSSDGPTTIMISATIAPHLLPIVAIAAYTYMALVPIIQPPIMRALTTPAERVIVMPEPKNVTKLQRIVFPFGLTIFTLLLVPPAAPLIGMLMLGSLIKESGVVDRYLNTLQEHLLNILTIFLGLCIGATAEGDHILKFRTVVIILLGFFAFAMGTVGGVLIAKLLCKLTGGKVNPLIGNSGVSAMPMAARVSQKVGAEYNPQNFLLMHAMGPIVASTIGSALVAGIFIALFGQ